MSKLKVILDGVETEYEIDEPDGFPDIVKYKKKFHYVESINLVHKTINLTTIYNDPKFEIGEYVFAFPHAGDCFFENEVFDGYVVGMEFDESGWMYTTDAHAVPFMEYELMKVV